MKCVDHCVVVNMNEMLIINSAEEKQFNFSVDILNICGGLNVEGLRTGSVLKVVKKIGNKIVKNETDLDLYHKGFVSRR